MFNVHATFVTVLVFGLVSGLRADVLDSYRWQSRLLVVSAPSETDAALAEQKALALRDIAGWTDRRLRLLEIVRGEVRENGVVVSVEGARILDRLGLQSQHFTAALVGLDGTVKLRQNHPIANRRLFSTIDSMPMRLEELRLRGRSSSDADH